MWFRNALTVFRLRMRNSSSMLLEQIVLLLALIVTDVVCCNVALITLPVNRRFTWWTKLRLLRFNWFKTLMATMLSSTFVRCSCIEGDYKRYSWLSFSGSRNPGVLATNLSRALWKHFPSIETEIQLERDWKSKFRHYYLKIVSLLSISVSPSRRTRNVTPDDGWAGRS